MKNKDTLQHAISEIRYVLDTDRLPEESANALEKVLDRLEALKPPAGVKSVEIRTFMHADPARPPSEGYANVVLCAGNGEEAHFRITGRVEMVTEKSEDERADRAFAEQLGVDYEEVRGFNEINRLQH